MSATQHFHRAALTTAPSYRDRKVGAVRPTVSSRRSCTAPREVGAVRRSWPGCEPRTVMEIPSLNFFSPRHETKDEFTHTIKRAENRTHKKAKEDFFLVTARGKISE